MREINPASVECHQVILKLCGEYLNDRSSGDDFAFHDVEESPQTQISNVYSMMWPNANLSDMEVLMQDNTWDEFLADDQFVTNDSN